jgi:hypothetical protein
MPNKTFWKGEWRGIEQPNPGEPKGRLGAKCAPFVEGEDVKWIAEGAYGASGNFVPASQGVRPVAPLPGVGDRTHRVVTSTDPWFDGKFAPERLAERLDLLAAEGWRVAAMAGTRLDPIVILERIVSEDHVAGARRLRGEPPAA